MYMQSRISKKKKRLPRCIILMGAVCRGMSGADRIAIELARQWSRYFRRINIISSNDGCSMLKDYGVSQRRRIYCKAIDALSPPVNNYVLLSIIYFARTLRILRVLLKESIKKNTVIYSSSDFWPDFFPALILKIKKQNSIKWIAGFYLFAPKPWQKNSPYKGKRWFIGLLYWLTQLPAYWLIKKYADIVFVTSEPDVKKFITEERGKNKVIVIRGGIDVEPSRRYLRSGKVVPVKKRKYDACFVGRFHYQKGVLELVDIWRLVCERRSDAKLAMIGVGPLEQDVKKAIQKYNLQGNIDLLGFRDGEAKYDIFKQSKVILHPATYDSGGMAACEAMAWGLPGVSFDLEALETYYPKGMLKTPCFNLKAFAKNILSLLENERLYQRMSREAIQWAREWDWSQKARGILKKVIKV